MPSGGVSGCVLGFATLRFVNGKWFARWMLLLAFLRQVPFSDRQGLGGWLYLLAWRSCRC